jgi:transcriptional regulator with XRE-family HTH domain
MIFKKTINDLMQRGWSQAAIAEHCNVTQGTISSLYRGETVDPRYNLAASILSLWKSKTPAPQHIRKNAK